ncbi:MAG: hypothetical protein EXQ64_03635 [Ilumatobacteraceae bacterium]|nr:hypothetical protein [Ilumatobacteraceae bacterium]
MENVLSASAFLGALSALWWYLRSHEAHWASKDGSRFTCRVYVVYEKGSTPSRWREARATITPDGLVQLRVRGVVKSQISGDWTMTGIAPDPPKGRNLYLLRQTEQLLLRVPAKSACVSRLDALVRKPNEPPH